MKASLGSVETLSVTINCSYETAFEYLAAPLNQKDWAIHFFQNIEEIEGEIIATLPFGKLPLEMKSDVETGVLDIHLGDGQPTRTRLIHIADNLNMYNFTLAQPKGMPDAVWENEALPNMQDELNILKSILEKK